VRSKIVTLVLAAAMLSGCSAARGLLSGKEGIPNEPQNIPVGNQLALPPDMALKAPSNTVDSYQPNTAAGAPVGDIYGDGTGVPAATTASGLPPLGKGDIYQQYGISKVKPNGSKKSQLELHTELTAAIKARKAKAKPRNGTIFNAGELFTEG
jgi:hypothetical protein